MSADLDVIRRILDGDREAFRLLVERYQGLLCCLVKNLIPDAHDAEDLAQDAFLAAYQHLASYDARQSAFSTWLLTIARNKCFNARKKQRPIVFEELPETAEPRTPAADLAEAEWFQQFDQALAALPFEQRTAFVLAEVQGLPHEEIARIEGVPLGTVKSRISRGKDKLRALLRHTVEQP